MKRLFRVFDLSKNEQRVIVMLVLIIGAFVQYERRIHRVHVRAPTIPEVNASPSPMQTQDEQ